MWKHRRRLSLAGGMLGWRWGQAALFLAGLMFLVPSCNLDLGSGDSACVPQCNAGNYRTDDGCGGICPCGGNYVCNETGQCVESDICLQNCDSFTPAWECGLICGNFCGACSAEETCTNGKCDCKPQCDGTHCRQDGCGGTCTCASGVCDANGNCAEEDCENPCSTKECGTECKVSCGECEGEFETCNASGQCECQPRACDGTRCDDGCGGTCTCADGKVCDGSGACVDDCDDTCGGQGWECGPLCGTECGPCDADEECIDHICKCQPTCDGTRCDDGCGGTCTCDEGTTCNGSGDCVVECNDTCEDMGWVCGDVCGEDCGTCTGDESCMEGFCFPSSLKLSLVNSKTNGSKTMVTLAIEYNPRDGEPRPRMADFRITTNKVIEMDIADPISGVAMTGKQFYKDPISQEDWQIRPDGSVQFLVYSLTSLATFGTGNVFIVTLACEIEDSVSFSLVRRNQTFAPFEADYAIQESAYDLPVVVTK